MLAMLMFYVTTNRNFTNIDKRFERSARQNITDFIKSLTL